MTNFGKKVVTAPFDIASNVVDGAVEFLKDPIDTTVNFAKDVGKGAVIGSDTSGCS